MAKKKQVKQVKSDRYQLNHEDVKKWALNTLIFLAPALLLFLTSIQAGNSLEDSLNVLYLWGLNVAIDLLKKFISGAK